MVAAGNVIFWVSLAGLFVLNLFALARSKNLKRFITYSVVLAVCAIVYFAFFQPSAGIVQKGDQSTEGVFIIILYPCMLLGMGCHYLYYLLLKPKRVRRFDVGGFLAPLFASPIVFIPLLAAFQDSGLSLAHLTLPKYMVFFVAFENGFFWKEVFENRRQDVKK
jgi:hypothetical protein